MNKILLIVIASFLLIACSNIGNKQDKWPPNCYPKKQLPYGNINRDKELNNDFKQYKNTENDEIAPVQISKILNDSNNNQNCNDYEFHSKIQKPIDGITPSAKFINDILDMGTILNKEAIKYLTKNIESITYIDSTHGFVSFSHPPTNKFADEAILPIRNIVGGTDLFYFEKENNAPKGFIFKNLSEIDNNAGINTRYWDSHPFAFKINENGIPITVLLWASDREAPFSKSIDIKGNIKKKGRTDIYYSLEINGKWIKAQKINSEEINNPSSSQGTPFIYCKCENPLLLFSTNKNDPTPEIIEKQRAEDFDIDSVRIRIDFEKAKDLKESDFNNPNKIKYLISQVGKVGSFAKKKNSEIYNSNNKPDSTINSISDDRFPYVPNPINRKNLFIYLSSNRNKKPFQYGMDKYIQSEGKYDIYHFPFNVKCEPAPPKPPCKHSLKITLYDITNGSLVKGTPTIKLLDDSKNLISESHTNPAEFQIDKMRTYYIAGGTDFQDISDKKCNEIISSYWVQHCDTTIDSKKIFLKDTITKLINIEELNDYLGNGKSLTLSNKLYYYNAEKYHADIILTETFLKQRPHPNNSNLVYVDLQQTQQIITKPKKIFLTTFKDNTVFDSSTVSSIKKNNVNSIKSLNGGIFTFNLDENCTTILDTIFLAVHQDTIKCIDLFVNILDNNNPLEIVKQPLFRVVEIGDSGNIIKEIKPYNLNIKNAEAKYHLKYGRRYKVFGGSDFKEDKLCKEKVLEYYYNCSNIKKDRLTEASVISKKTREYAFINTINYPSLSTIKDTVIICPKYYEPIPCVYAFDEYKKELHKKVPYFQTAYWVVNTKKNFNKFKREIKKKNSIFRTPFRLSGPPPPPAKSWSGWYSGMKWIDLHPSNSYYFNSIDKSKETDQSYHAKVQARITQRYACYNSYAKQVSRNLQIIQDVICNDLIKAYNYISTNAPNCQYCGDKKFIIRIEAWSDARPVTHGWYVTDDSNYKFVKYAECNDINDFNSSNPKLTFNPVKIKQFTPLGKNNRVLSQLRAYYGYLEIYNNYLKGKLLKNDGTPYRENEILLPDELVDNDGKLLPNEKIKELIEKSKIIIVAKGYSTTPTKDSKWSKYIRCGNRYDGIRSLSIIVKPMQFYEGKMIEDECCDPNKLIIKKENKLDNINDKYSEYDKKNNKFIISFGSYQKQSYANNVYNYLNKIPIKNIRLEKMQIKNSVFYKVFIGPFDSYNKAKRYIQSINLKKLKRNNVEYSILRYNK